MAGLPYKNVDKFSLADSMLCEVDEMHSKMITTVAISNRQKRVVAVILWMPIWAVNNIDFI